MSAAALIATSRALLAGDKGLLAIDESNATCNKRFAALGIGQTEDARRAWRELILSTRGLGDSISGVIMYDETIRQTTKTGVPFTKLLADAGIVPGIKVDVGVFELAGHSGEKITEGLDGLRGRLKAYASLGARFAKWRAVFAIDRGLPSHGCIAANAMAMARYAALCQEAGMVPIVEPELLMDGDHGLQQSQEVAEDLLCRVFATLISQNVLLEGMVLKPAMVLPGLSCLAQPTLDQVADATVQCLTRTVPAAVAGIAFLSGGQDATLASARLNAINLRYESHIPWPLTFSFARAIQQPALEIWRGEDTNRGAAQRALAHRASLNRAARRGEYSAAMEAP